MHAMTSPKFDGVIPDSAWSWLICLGNIMISFSTIGIFRCFGVLYPAIIDDFGVRYGDVSLMSGMFNGAMAFGALLMVLVKRYGCRRVGMISSFAYSASLFAGALSSSIEMLIVFCGVLAGFSAGILLNLMCLTCAMYFVKHRSKASGIAMAGIPIGSLIGAPALDFLIECYTWRGALMVTSAFAFHACAATSLYRPIWRSETPNAMDGNQEPNGETDKCQRSNKSAGQASRKKFKISSIVDYKLFTKPVFILTFLSSMTYWPANIGAVFLLVPFGMETLDVDRTRASLLLTVQSVGELVGKLICGPLGDFHRINRFLLLAVATVLNALSFLGITFCQSYLQTNIVAFAQGLICAFYGGLYIVLYNDVFGLKKMTRAISYEGFVSAIVTLPLLYILGIIIDATNGVRVPYYVCAGTMICCSACLFGIFALKR